MEVILINSSIHKRNEGLTTSITMKKEQIVRVIKEHLLTKIKMEDVDYIAQILIEHENEIIKLSTFE
jgi:hypothetical protein